MHSGETGSIWIQRTDGLPICTDCIHKLTRFQGGCSIGKNKQTTSVYPVSCGGYKSKLKGDSICCTKLEM